MAYVWEAGILYVNGLYVELEIPVKNKHKKLLAVHNACSLRELSTSCSLFKDKRQWKGKDTRESSSSDSSDSDSDEGIKDHITDKITHERDDARHSDSKIVKSHEEQKGNDNQLTAQAGPQKGRQGKKKKIPVFAEEGKEMTRAQLDEAILAAAKSVAEELQGDTGQIQSLLVSKLKSQMEVTAAQKMGEAPKAKKPPIMESESKETAKLDSKQAPRKTQKDTAAAARKPVSGASISSVESKETADQDSKQAHRKPKRAAAKQKPEVATDVFGDLLKDMTISEEKSKRTASVEDRTTEINPDETVAPRLLLLSPLPEGVTNSEMKKFFMNPKCRMSVPRMKLDGSGESFCYVVFPTSTEAQKAYREKQGSDFKGEKIHLEFLTYTGPETYRRTLWLKHLPAHVTEEELKALSEDIKKVELEVIMLGGMPVWCARVQFESEEVAEKNLVSLDEAELRGHKIFVEYLERQKEKKRRKAGLFVKNLPPDFDREQIKALSKDIKIVTFPGMGLYPVLNFESKKVAEKNFFALMGRKVQGRKIYVDFWENDNSIPDRATSRLFVKNLPLNINEKQLEALSKDIKGVTIHESSMGRYAFLEFESEEVAEKNLDSLMEREVSGQKIYVDFWRANKIKQESLASRSLYVTNFPARVKEEQLEEQLVEQLEALSRDIKRAKVLEGPKGLYAFLEFESKEVAEKNFYFLKDAKVWGQKIFIALRKKGKDLNMRALDTDNRNVDKYERARGPTPEDFYMRRQLSKQIDQELKQSEMPVSITGRPLEDQSERPTRVEREEDLAKKTQRSKQSDQEFEQDEMPVSSTGRPLEDQSERPTRVQREEDVAKKTQMSEQTGQELEQGEMSVSTTGRPLEDQSERPRVQRERGFAMKPRMRKQIDQEFEQDEMSVSTTGRPSEDQFERPRVQRERSFAMKPRMRKKMDQEFEQDEMSVSTTGFLSTGQFTGERLNIFSREDLQAVPEVTGENKLFDQVAKELAEEMITLPPSNAFEEQIQWTKEGKLWTFPINNEQGWEEEANVSFEEHVFLEDQLEGFPQKGPVRHFMELVTTALSKNPYLTVAQKREHIDWFRDYFEDKKAIIEENIDMDPEDQAVELGN